MHLLEFQRSDLDHLVLPLSSLLPRDWVLAFRPMVSLTTEDPLFLLLLIVRVLPRLRRCEISIQCPLVALLTIICSRAFNTIGF
jgi:hypothetical protein